MLFIHKVLGNQGDLLQLPTQKQMNLRQDSNALVVYPREALNMEGTTQI